MRVKVENNEPNGCTSCVVLFLLNITFGTMAISTILSWFGINIPFLGDLLLGFVAGEIAIPIAIVGFILKLFGVF